VTALTEAFGARVRDRRLDLDMSQDELSARCGLHRTYISSIEQGRRNLALHNIAKLARALEIPVHELVRGIDDRNNWR
jgi:transcriptional regulator with XRE-family HTH domain